MREVWDDQTLEARAHALRAFIETAPRQDARVRVELEDFEKALPAQLQRFRERRAFVERLLQSQR